MLLLAAAFGVGLPGLVDLTLFTPVQAEITFWDELWQPTELEALGTSAHPAVTFVLGHVVLSMAVPLAMLDGLAPGLRGRRLLRPRTWWALIVPFVAVAALIRSEAIVAPNTVPSAAQTGTVVGVMSALVAGALWLAARRRSGHQRPPPAGAGARPQAGRAVPRARWLVVAGAVAVLTVDLFPATWLGLSVVLAVAVVAAVAIARWSRRWAWGTTQIAAVATGALVGRSLIGFLVPLPAGSDLAGKYAQNVVLLIAAALIGRLAIARSVADPAPVERLEAPTHRPEGGGERRVPGEG
jgi:hypothetical protein